MPDFDLLVERFLEDHPAMHDSLVAFARAALAFENGSPCEHALHHVGTAYNAATHFGIADPKVANTYQREVIVEYGAVVIAGLILHKLQNLRLTRVTRRGSRVDYFVGTNPGDQLGILEVSGTDEGRPEDRIKTKRGQLLESPYRKPPFSLHGWAAVTRFAPPLTSVVESIAKEA